MYCILNGEIISEEHALVSINGRGFRYGDGCFETMKFQHGKLLLSDFHYDRFIHALDVLEISAPDFFDKDYFIQQVRLVTEKNGHTALSRIRLTAFVGDGLLSNYTNRQLQWCVQSWDISSQQSDSTKGIAVTLYNHGFKAADGFANIKSNNFLLYSQAAMYAKKNGFDDAFVSNHLGQIIETSIANFFILKENEVFTPALSEGPIAGVMRRFLIDFYRSKGYKVNESSVSIDNLLNADGIIVSNAMGIRWINRFDDITYNYDRIKDLFDITNRYLSTTS